MLLLFETLYVVIITTPRCDDWTISLATGNDSSELWRVYWNFSELFGAVLLGLRTSRGVGSNIQLIT